MKALNLQFFGGRGSAGGNSPTSKASIESKVTNALNKFVQEYDISERSRMYEEELSDILKELPVGARIYTGSKTLFGPGAVVDGKRVSEADTFFEKVSDEGAYSKYMRFGKDSDYEKEYVSSIRKELARGKRLNKLNIRIEKK